MVERQKQSTLKPEGWETLDIKQKRFLCFKPIEGSDDKACEAVSTSLKDVFAGKNLSRSTVQRWRKKHPHFGRIERELLDAPLVLTSAMMNDLLPVATWRTRDALMSDDIRTADNAANRVFKYHKLIGGEERQGGATTLVIMPAVFAEREQIAGTTDYRFIEGVPAPLGAGTSPQIEQEDQGSELGEEVG